MSTNAAVDYYSHLEDENGKEPEADYPFEIVVGGQTCRPLRAVPLAPVAAPSQRARAAGALRRAWNGIQGTRFEAGKGERVFCAVVGVAFFVFTLVLAQA